MLIDVAGGGLAPLQMHNKNEVCGTGRPFMVHIVLHDSNIDYFCCPSTFIMPF